MKIAKYFANKAGELNKTLTADAVELVIQVDEKEVVRVSVASLDKDIMQQAALHGLSQKIGDSASGWKTAGFDPIAAMQATASQVTEAKVWNRVRTGEGTSPQTSLLVEALAAVTDKPLDKCREAVDGLDKEQQKALRNRPTIAAEIQKIKAKRAEEAAARAAAKAEEADDDLADLF